MATRRKSKAGTAPEGAKKKADLARLAEAEKEAAFEREATIAHLAESVTVPEGEEKEPYLARLATTLKERREWLAKQPTPAPRNIPDAEIVEFFLALLEQIPLMTSTWLSAEHKSERARLLGEIFDFLVTQEGPTIPGDKTPQWVYDPGPTRQLSRLISHHGRERLTEPQWQYLIKRQNDVPGPGLVRERAQEHGDVCRETLWQIVHLDPSCDDELIRDAVQVLKHVRDKLTGATAGVASNEPSSTVHFADLDRVEQAIVQKMLREPRHPWFRKNVFDPTRNPTHPEIMAWKTLKDRGVLSDPGHRKPRTLHFARLTGLADVEVHESWSE